MENKKWIHLRGLEGELPDIGIEGLSDYETILWLREAINFLQERNRNNLKLREYEERTSN